MNKRGTSCRVTLKGLALIAAIETGLLPEIERDGVVGYDDELFGRCIASLSLASLRNTPHNNHKAQKKGAKKKYDIKTPIPVILPAQVRHAAERPGISDGL